MMVQGNPEPLTLPPSTVPTMSRLKLPATLMVPLLSDTDAPTSGTRVKPGEAITPGVIAPAAGWLGEFHEVPLLDARGSRAIELTADGAEEEPPAAAEAPDNLPMLIERLRNAGVCAARRTSPDLLAQLSESVHHPPDTLICN